MNTHPIDPTKPRDGFLVTITYSAGSVTRYARDRSEMEELVMKARASGRARAIDVKTVDADVQPNA